MKSYNIKDIAAMLNTNPETVRRWIRNKKLHAESVSKQDGTVVSEKELVKFILSNPKYERTALVTLLSPLGVPFGISAGLGVAIASALSYKDFKNNTELRIRLKDLEPLIKTEIKRLSGEKESIEKEIERQKKELDDINERIESYKLFLEDNGKAEK